MYKQTQVAEYKNSLSRVAKSLCFRKEKQHDIACSDISPFVNPFDVVRTKGGQNARRVCARCTRGHQVTGRQVVAGQWVWPSNTRSHSLARSPHIGHCRACRVIFEQLDRQIWRNFECDGIPTVQAQVRVSEKKGRYISFYMKKSKLWFYAKFF